MFPYLVTDQQAYYELQQVAANMRTYVVNLGRGGRYNWSQKLDHMRSKDLLRSQRSMWRGA